MDPISVALLATQAGDAGDEFARQAWAAPSVTGSGSRASRCWQHRVGHSARGQA